MIGKAPTAHIYAIIWYARSIANILERYQLVSMKSCPQAITETAAATRECIQERKKELPNKLRPLRLCVTMKQTRSRSVHNAPVLA